MPPVHATVKPPIKVVRLIEKSNQRKNIAVFQILSIVPAHRKSSKTFGISTRNCHCSSTVFRVLSFFPEGKEIPIPIRSRWIAGGKKRGRGSDENKISRACFSYFGFFSFFSSRSLSAKVNGACARCAEKVMDRALNVGSHGIWENARGGEGREGGKRARCVAPIGCHRPPPRLSRNSWGTNAALLRLCVPSTQRLPS